MERGGKTRGRGRGRGKPRNTVEEMVKQPNVVKTPYPFQSTGRNRGRPRKKPTKTVNAIDDDSNPSFPENSRKRRRLITRDEDDELNSSSSKELLTDGQDSSDTSDEDSSDTTDEEYTPSVPKTSRRNRGRPRTTPQEAVNPADDESNPSFPESSRKRGRQITRAEADKLNSSSSKELFTDGPSHHVQDSGVARDHPLPRNLVMSVTGENVKSSHHVRDSGVAFNHPLPCDLVMSVTGENENSSHLAMPVDESNPIETEADLCSPTKGKGVSAEPASETVLRGNNVSGLLGENIAKNSVFSDSSKSNCGSSILRCKRSKDAPIVPRGSCVKDDQLPHARVKNVAKDARTTTFQSFNLTDAVDKIHNTLHGDDGEDIQSTFNPSSVVVKGYRVKPEIVPLLNQIFEQHGDIVKNCKVKGLQGCFLEIVCSVYEKLQKSLFQEIKRDELYEMGETLDGLEEIGLNVKWLSDRLYDILDTRVFLKVYDQKRRELKEQKDRLIALKNEEAQIRERMSVLETDISMMKGEEEKVQKTRNLLNSSLVDGLIRA